MPDIAVKVIGYIESGFKEKFGIPRQSGLVKSKAIIRLEPEFSVDDALRELDGFSHLWVIFYFHGLDINKKNWQATVRPPRLGGNRKVGVFASRSMFRPSPIGLSVVKLERIDKDRQSLLLYISGGDMLDKTPVLDIKPYIPYVDCVSSATAGYATEPPGKVLTVSFESKAELALETFENFFPGLKDEITELLQLDPGPAYKKGKQAYAMRLYNFDIKWEVEAKQARVLEILEII